MEERGINQLEFFLWKPGRQALRQELPYESRTTTPGSKGERLRVMERIKLPPPHAPGRS